MPGPQRQRNICKVKLVENCKHKCRFMPLSLLQNANCKSANAVALADWEVNENGQVANLDLENVFSAL